MMGRPELKIPTLAKSLISPLVRVIIKICKKYGTGHWQHNLYEFTGIRMNFFQVYQKLQSSSTKFTCEFGYEFVHEFAYEFVKTREKIRTRISEISARILKEESNLCTNLNKPT